jgi:transposase
VVVIPTYIHSPFTSNILMDPTKDQIRSLLLYEFNLGRGATEATQNICAVLGEDAVNLQTTQRWFAKFRDDSQDLKDQPQSGRPRELDRDAVLAEVEANQTKSTRMLAADFDCGNSQIFRILKKAGKT